MKTKLIIIFSLIFLIFNKYNLYAQGNMPDAGENNNIVVMIITIIIWLALGIYISSLDRKVKFLEKKLDDE